MEDKAGLKSLHDRLLAEKPEGVEHDNASCPLCAIEEANDPTGGSVTTYTDEDVKAAVDKAVLPLQARITELEQSNQVSEVESAKAAIQSDMQAKIDEVQRQLDEAVLKAETAEQEKTAIVAWLDSEKAAAAEAEIIKARKDERLTKIREAANFPQDYLEKNGDRFAAMSDEDFEAALDGWKAIGGGSGAGTQVPTETALHAARESDPVDGGSALKEIMGLRRQGPVDFSTL